MITFLWKLKGKALAAMGSTEEAQPLLRAAIDKARATGERFLLWRLHASLARLYRAMGSQSEAEKEFSTARELIEELANTVPNGEARGNISQRAHDRLRLQASVSDPDELRILLGRRETEPRASNGL